MKIDEIRTQINEINSAKMFCISNGFMKPLTGDSWFQTAARILVDRTYEAGESEGYDRGFDACYTEGYNAAAKDPKAWYAKGKNGEHFHFGDRLRRGRVEEVIDRFGMADDGTLCINGHYARYCVKVFPDTREKIKEELTASLYENAAPDIDIDAAIDQAEQFISRIEALEKQ